MARDTAEYEALMRVIRGRRTSRAFDPDFCVPAAHYDMILEAARHAPSGANSQPWHFVVVQDAAMKQKLGDYFVREARRRAKLRMKFPRADHSGISTIPRP